jgi:tagatose 1,6-diphosphate aldolase
MKISPGKLWGLRRLADTAGHWKMVAIDQRTPLFEPIAQKRGTKEPPFEDVTAVKRLLARHLAPKASAILTDPIYGYLPTVGEIPASIGLVLSYEHSVTENTPQGRKTVPIPDWSVAKSRRIGGDAVKVLVWYRADAAPEIRAHQEAFVKAAGDACREHDTVMLLEVLIYPLEGESATALEPRRAQLVLDSVRPFCDPKYGVDIFKLEPPGPVHNVPDPAGKDASALQASYDKMAAMVPRPWVMLSAGAGAADFERSLNYAYRAGAAGYLAGRAIWSQAFGHFPDFAAMERSLASDSVAVLDRLNALTDAKARPWYAHASFGGSTPVPASREQVFPADYVCS